ncbi:hypothetical protein ElyMa_004805100 [Elysia marginata]|uniref:Uncharacterized protein n=1 Tax=Elysia marginata TaxID=1093978 RepID=A0AAV4IIT5_9GAST|nr:hypothetical protein ElyMa_004805100 [Elysia marginata]
METQSLNQVTANDRGTRGRKYVKFFSYYCTFVPNVRRGTTHGRFGECRPVEVPKIDRRKKRAFSLLLLWRCGRGLDRQTELKWFAFPQVLQVFPFAGQVGSRDLCPVRPKLLHVSCAGRVGNCGLIGDDLADGSPSQLVGLIGGAAVVDCCDALSCSFVCFTCNIVLSLSPRRGRWMEAPAACSECLYYDTRRLYGWRGDDSRGPQSRSRTPTTSALSQTR